MANESLLNLAEAAALLGYAPSGLRKIVNRTKHGEPGAVIRFMQVGRGPIRFRREWLEQFIDANTTGPKPVDRSPARKPLQGAESQFGFDPKYFRRSTT
jgi:hypothetical protein